MKKITGYLEDNTDIPSGKEECIISLLLKSRNDVHITHLLNKSKLMSPHKALETYYDSITDLIDTFTETSLVWYPKDSIEVGESCCIDNPEQYFRELYNKIQILRVKYKESFLQNQIDEVQTLISQTLYRLIYMVS